MKSIAVAKAHPKRIPRPVVDISAKSGRLGSEDQISKSRDSLVVSAESSPNNLYSRLRDIAKKGGPASKLFNEYLILAISKSEDSQSQLPPSHEATEDLIERLKRLGEGRGYSTSI